MIKGLRLQKKLDMLGYKVNYKVFEQTVDKYFFASFPYYSQEDLLHHPHDALEFCRILRSKTDDVLPDHLILETLTNNRKKHRVKTKKKVNPVKDNYP